MMLSGPAVLIKPPRDQLLDLLRGMAILLVVIGHQLQGAYPDFDDQFWFRLIYSFHMPLFMFLGGMAVAMRLWESLGATPQTGAVYLLDASREVYAKSLRLLLPFFAWGVVMYFLRDNYAAMPPLDYAILLFKSPDNGLWFLPALFFCHVFFVLAKLIFFVFVKFKLDKYKLGIFSLSLLCAYKALLLCPDFLALYLSKAYFPYFAAGALWVLTRWDKLPGLVHELPFVLFLILFPFWHRTQPSDVIGQAWGALHIPNPQFMLKALVAFSAIYIILQAAKKMKAFSWAYLSNIFVFLGKRSLDVYAIHFFFLGYFSYLFGTLFAICASLLISFVMRESLLFGFLFFGEKNK